MNELTNNIQNNTLSALAQKAAPGVLTAIKHASAKTGVNFAYMVKQAAAESSFNPTAKAKSSSASGLYQFIESTWMNMVEKHGAKYGIDTDGKSRAEILALRNDPKAASFMAAAFAGENEKFLNNNWGGKVGDTELYFAHFMGAGGASAFLKARDENPMQQAALIFPKEAQANRNVFYDTKTGHPRSLDEVYAFFDKKFSGENVKTVEKTPPKIQPEKPESLVFTPSNHPSYNSLVSNTFSRSPKPASLGAIPFQRLVNSPVEIMLLAQLGLPGIEKNNDNSLF